MIGVREVDSCVLVGGIGDLSVSGSGNVGIEMELVSSVIEVW